MAQGECKTARNGPSAGPSGPVHSPGIRTPLDATLRVPSPRPDWVERSDLLGALGSVTTKLILIAAPAGYGKTTLLAQWCSRPAAGRSFAWVSLDRGDNDPMTLWSHVTHALRRSSPPPEGGKVLRSVHSRHPDAAGMVQGLINELAAQPARVAILLDNYDLITELACHEQLEFLLRHLPPQAQLVISSRTVPALPLARLRVSAELTELRMADLRLTRDEAAVVVGAVAGARLGDDDLRELVERTEGWPAGVYLAALSLRDKPDPGACIRQFTGSHRHVDDFLTDEVINRQPSHIRQFLLHTAVLGRLTAPLCETVTERPDAREILEVLDGENLFLVPLDDARRWFRYHRLFADALQNQLARAEPGLAPVLHMRASNWYRQRGSAREAIQHALAAGDTDAVIALIGEHWLRYIDSGRAATVRGWFGALGDDIIAARPLAAHCAAWVAALTGEREALTRWLTVVEAAEDIGPLPDGVRSLESSVALLNGTFGFRGLAAMRLAAARAAELETDDSSPWYALAHAALGCSLYWGGDLTAAARWLQQAVTCEASITTIRLLALSLLTLVALERGRPGQARDLARSTVMTGEGHGLSEAPQGAFAPLAVGAVYASQGRLEEARQQFDRALRLRRRSPGISPWPTLELLLRLAAVLQDLDDGAGASALLAEARDMLNAYPEGAGAQFDRLARLELRLQSQAAASLCGDLTAREEAVLRLLRGSLSRREIGQELYVSANTVKSHTRAIYRKLGVSNRHDAVRRGQDLGIL